MKVLQTLTRASSLIRTFMNAPPGTAETAAKSGQLLSLLPDVPVGCRRIFLLRHGETDWNARGLMQGGGFDIELNANGRRQAELAADELAGIDFGVVASSHLQRSKQTADIILSRNCGSGTPRVTLKGLGEMRFGELEGNAIRGPDATEETVAKLESCDAKMRVDATVPWPGPEAESTQDVYDRGTDTVSQLLDDYSSALNVCIVAHGRFNKILLASLLWQSPLEYRRIEQGNTCINVVDFDGDSYKEVLISYVDHIEREKDEGR
eukprot:CAMPEP_0194053354 /NCGR_PEP_ID=MMETSP0009_2-20130614/49447_1 /TAXON_ID=210454 /ORGANISM="Grammatophora oceanica, Strain CCMP 410" /LENGTH=264 /DNA_ID=CAMNT_0038701393 /DNA_START=12 /DNA_END=806 /DNA_ORIENTATION=+